MSLQGKVAIVTGAGSGIGRNIAVRLADEGARVVVADVQYMAAESTAALIRGNGGKAIAIRTDVSSREEVIAMVSETLEHWNHVDILVNNAGVSGEHSFLSLEEAEWDRVLSINLKGTFLCGQAVARSMVEAGRGGKIVNIASVNSKVVLPGLAHYCASKGGVYMLTKAMAVELAPYRINVNAVGPGVIETELTAPALADPDRLQFLLGHIPLGRIGQTDDVAEAVTFLVSDKSNYITGTCLFVDGGWLLE